MGRDTYTRQWTRCGAHGGTLVENYDQASSRDLLAESMRRVDEMDGFDLLLSIHDEVVAEASKGACTLSEFEAVVAQVPEWAPGMPISAEGWIGERLRK
jgi:DNA polymerase